MEVVEMGLFGKKKKTVDLQQVFKDKYNDLLDLIDQGVDFDKAHFLSMQQDLKKQIDLLKGL